VFVLGAPRSGTTLVGSYVGSAPGVCDLGEYAGFYFTLDIAEFEYRRVPSHYKECYLTELREHAREFPLRIARERGYPAYCDSTPWNLLIAAELVERLPDALFILTVRDVSGLSQSLARSYVSGYAWAGATIEERAQLWRRFYAHAPLLDPARTVIVDYDELCASPVEALDELDHSLFLHGVSGPLDRSVLCKSHANPPEARRATLGVHTPAGNVEYTPRPSVDAQTWLPGMEAAARPLVEDAAVALTRFRADVAATTSTVN